MFNPKFPAVFMVKFTAWWCNNHLETWWSSSMGRMTSHILWKMKFMFQTTNQYLVCSFPNRLPVPLFEVLGGPPTVQRHHGHGGKSLASKDLLWSMDLVVLIFPFRWSWIFQFSN
jgi:hypothetical protein